MATDFSKYGIENYNQKLQSYVETIKKKIENTFEDKYLKNLKKQMSESYEIGETSSGVPLIIIKDKGGFREGIRIKNGWEDNLKCVVNGIDKFSKLKLLGSGGYNYFVKKVNGNEKTKIVQNGCIKGELLFNNFLVTYEIDECLDEIEKLIKSITLQDDYKYVNNLYKKLGSDIKEMMSEVIFRPTIEKMSDVCGNADFGPINEGMLKDMLCNEKIYNDFLLQFGMFAKIE